MDVILLIGMFKVVIYAVHEVYIFSITISMTKIHLSQNC